MQAALKNYGLKKEAVQQQVNKTQTDSKKLRDAELYLLEKNGLSPLTNSMLKDSEPIENTTAELFPSVADEEIQEELSAEAHSQRKPSPKDDELPLFESLIDQVKIDWGTNAAKINRRYHTNLVRNKGNTQSVHELIPDTDFEPDSGPKDTLLKPPNVTATKKQ